MSDLTSSLKMSRTTLMVMSGSAYSSAGALDDWDFVWMSCHCASRRVTSRERSSSLAPSAAVRTMTPPSSGSAARRTVFRRLRSLSGSLRLMPVVAEFGT